MDGKITMNRLMRYCNSRRNYHVINKLAKHIKTLSMQITKHIKIMNIQQKRHKNPLKQISSKKQ